MLFSVPQERRFELRLNNYLDEKGYGVKYTRFKTWLQVDVYDSWVARYTQDESKNIATVIFLEDELKNFDYENARYDEHWGLQDFLRRFYEEYPQFSW